VLLVIWSLVALAGAYPITAIPLWIGAGLLTCVERPALAAPRARLLDIALIALLAGIVLQLVPIGADAVRAADPAASRLLDQLVIAPRAHSAIRLSIDPPATMRALVELAGAVLLFWTCRQIFERGGAWLMARAITMLGLVVCAIALVQRVTNHHRIYGIFEPHQAGAEPFGPFVNPDHFATWIVMAIPLVAGYGLAHRYARTAGVHRTHLAWTARVSRALADAQRVWIVSAVGVMAVALVATRSRSGLAGLAAAALAGIWISRRRLTSADRWWLLLAAAAVSLVVLSYADVGRLATHVGLALSDSSEHRLDIWHDTVRIARDFWLTGAGAGSFGRAMLVYQSADRDVFFNQAHNQYLQLLAEGGLLLAVPALLAALALGRAVRRALAEDRTPGYWIRAGAAAGLCGVAVQSLWETGLRLPANAVLFAVLAAAATATRRGVPEPSARAVRPNPAWQPGNHSVQVARGEPGRSRHAELAADVVRRWKQVVAQPAPPRPPIRQRP
jgi:O-antigen ligase